MNNFRLVMSGIDVAPLLDQVLSHPEFWNSDELWLEHKRDTVLYAGENMVLRYIMAQPEPTREAFGVLSAAQKIVFDLMRELRGVRLGNVIISRLAPGAEIKPHTDLMPWINPDLPFLGRHQPIYQRYQIPLTADPGVWFFCGDEQLEMTPGEVWWFDNQQEHSVSNASPKYRYSMFCDVKPFTLPD